MWIINNSVISTSGKFEKIKKFKKPKKNDGWRIRPCGNARSPIVSPFSLGSLSPQTIFLVTNSRAAVLLFQRAHLLLLG
jgi:hypothetical protein